MNDLSGWDGIAWGSALLCAIYTTHFWLSDADFYKQQLFNPSERALFWIAWTYLVWPILVVIYYVSRFFL